MARKTEKIKLLVNIKIEDCDVGKVINTQKVMSLDAFCSMIGRDEPSLFDDCDAGFDNGLEMIVLSMLILDGSVYYGVTNHDGNEQEVTAKLVNYKAVNKALVAK